MSTPSQHGAQPKHTRLRSNAHQALPCIPIIMPKPKPDGKFTNKAPPPHVGIVPARASPSTMIGCVLYLIKNTSKAAACRIIVTCADMGWTNTDLRDSCRNNSSSKNERLRQGHEEPHFEFSSKISRSSTRGNPWSRRRVSDRDLTHTK